MNDAMKAKAKALTENPLMASLTTFTVLGGAIIMLMNVTGIYDAAHVSEAELAIVTTKSTCENLAIRISLVEQAIWQMEQAGTEQSQRMLEKKRELRQLEQKFESINCASVIQ